MKFKVGDIVEFGGLEGVVVFNKNINREYPIRVKFEEYKYEHFTEDGRFYKDHTKPLLNLVERPEIREVSRKDIIYFMKTIKLNPEKEDGISDVNYLLGNLGFEVKDEVK